ncbi:MAG TPA: hypothetical protein VFM15_10235 [Gammaproteobacteria bacterium]|nr:hypothetical protein [Gammaproteobacteria bacterium]
MPRRSPPRADDSRRLLTQEAARIMAEEGVRDFLFAKRKAAERLGFDPRSLHLPTNLELEQALRERQRLFQSESQPGWLRDLRLTAREAMQLLEHFNARLVGPVLAGTAAANAAVHLHVFSDLPEQLAIFLMEKNIPYEVSARKLKSGAGVVHEYPVYRFVAGDVPIELTVFGVDGIREAPASPVDGRPMRRASLRELEALLAAPPCEDTALRCE